MRKAIQEPFVIKLLRKQISAVITVARRLPVREAGNLTTKYLTMNLTQTQIVSPTYCCHVKLQHCKGYNTVFSIHFETLEICAQDVSNFRAKIVGAKMKAKHLLRYIKAVRDSIEDDAPQRMLILSASEVNQIFIYLSKGKCIVFPDGIDLHRKERVDARWIAKLLVNERQKEILK